MKFTKTISITKDTATTTATTGDGFINFNIPYKGIKQMIIRSYNMYNESDVNTYYLQLFNTCKFGDGKVLLFTQADEYVNSKNDLLDDWNGMASVPFSIRYMNGSAPTLDDLFNLNLLIEFSN